MAKTGGKADSTTGVVGYCRVKPQELSPLALSLKDQEKAIRKECTKRGFELVALYSDAGLPETQGRPALSAALASLNEGNGSILMVTKLDRLTRSMHVAARVLASAERGGWAIVALGLRGRYDQYRRKRPDSSAGAVRRDGAKTPGRARGET